MVRRCQATRPTISNCCMVTSNSCVLAVCVLDAVTRVYFCTFLSKYHSAYCACRSAVKYTNVKKLKCVAYVKRFVEIGNRQKLIDFT